jgi:hypothetical protein
MNSSRPARGLLPLLFFVGVACVTTFPLVINLSSRLPGEVAGDNVTFLWNIWWGREALAHGAGAFFYSPLLFAPFGFNLTLHTNTALQAMFGAVVLGEFSSVTAQNLIILATLTLNGFSAFLFARDRTGSSAPALMAGVVFGVSPYVSAHLLGHFSLIGVWCLPLFLWCITRALERKSSLWSFLAGLTFVAVAYTDYYYLVYCSLLAVCAVVSGTGLFLARVEPTPLRRKTMLALASILAVLAALVAIISVTGGVDTTVLGLRINATESSNLVTIGWFIILGAVYIRLRPRVSIRVDEARSALVERLRLAVPGVITVGVGLLPIFMGTLALWRSGDYTAPTHFWRTGPGGVDLLTLALGNSFHPLTGGWTAAAYQRMGIDRVEESGWLGILPTLFLGLGVWRAGAHRDLRRAVAAAIAFFVWALGPWLTIAGLRTGVLLPANFLGLIPVLSNARMPGRAIVVTSLAAATIGARLVAALPTRQRNIVAVVATLFVLFEYLPAPYPSILLEIPQMYSQLRSAGPGAVIELPMGLRDGFGQVGMFDDRTLFYQTQHGHPLVGGFAARIPGSIRARYASLPVIRSLLRCSDPKGCEPAPEDEKLGKTEAAFALRSIGVRYVVIDRTRATTELTVFIEKVLPLTLLASESSRDLFELSD